MTWHETACQARRAPRDQLNMDTVRRNGTVDLVAIAIQSFNDLLHRAQYPSCNELGLDQIVLINLISVAMNNEISVEGIADRQIQVPLR